MERTIALVVSIIVFVVWMNLVGSPSSIETIIGLGIAGFVWFYICKNLDCLNEDWNK